MYALRVPLVTLQLHCFLISIYFSYPLLGSGEVFGPTIYINLLLLELKECMPALEGVRM